MSKIEEVPQQRRFPTFNPSDVQGGHIWLDDKDRELNSLRDFTIRLSGENEHHLLAQALRDMGLLTGRGARSAISQRDVDPARTSLMAHVILSKASLYASGMEQLPPGAYSDPVVVPAPPDELDRGAWRAVASFRKLDGNEVQWELRAWGDTEDSARQAAISAIDVKRGAQVQTMGFDTPAVQKYIAAASHMHDLRQAMSALDAAAASMMQISNGTSGCKL